MYKIFVFILLFLSSVYQLDAQLFPREGSKLSYRIIGFSFPANEEADKYKIEIALGNYNSIDSFKSNIILKLYTEKNKMIAEVPSFGCQYTWRVKYIGKDSSKIKSPLNHFSTGIIPSVDTNKYRLKITTATKQYQDAFVFMDGSGVLYDMNGQPVWYLPDIDENKRTDIRDLKLSPLGTVTFMVQTKIYEVNYNGDILWRKSGKETVAEIDDLSNPLIDSRDNYYHHEFTRLSNGHYMVLGLEFPLCKLRSSNNDSFQIIGQDNTKTNNGGYQRFKFGTLIEYDEKGNLVWFWESSKYIMGSDLVSYYNNAISNSTDLHDNAFFFDEQNKNIYVSFRNISRVIKVKYPQGNVLNTYGKVLKNDAQYSTDPAQYENSLFCTQHACRRSKKGYLYLFNNGCDSTTNPTITLFRESAGNLPPEKIWEYSCNFDDMRQYMGPQKNMGGGNVIELPDQSIFAASGYQYSKVFIVDLNKKILWSAVPERFDSTEKKWKNTNIYRASIIPSRKDLEKLIWNSETDNNHVSTKATL